MTAPRRRLSNPAQVRWENCGVEIPDPTDTRTTADDVLLCVDCYNEVPR